MIPNKVLICYTIVCKILIMSEPLSIAIKRLQWFQILLRFKEARCLINIFRKAHYLDLQFV